MLAPTGVPPTPPQVFLLRKNNLKSLLPKRMASVYQTATKAPIPQRAGELGVPQGSSATL